jgi:sugar lactone lactonase YvrE
MRSRRSALLAAALFGSLFAFAQGSARADGSSPQLVYPNGLALDADGQLLISDIGSHSIYKCDSEGHLAAIAGTGKAGFSGDGERAWQAKLNAPFDVLFIRGDGSMLVADTYNHRIRRIDRTGRISTIAGNGKSAYTGDGSPATEASLQLPQSIAVDSQGNLYIADTFNHVVRRVDKSGRISTFAGSEPGLAGDGGPATKAQLNMPLAVAVDAEDRLYICDSSNSRIRRVNRDGTIETVCGSGGGAGIGGAGFGGDKGPVARAKLFCASDIKFDSDGNWLISDSGNNRIRTVREGQISTVAGTGTAGFSGDGGPADAATLKAPQKMVVSRDGNIYFADRTNHRVRRIDPDGTITTFVGDGAPDVAIHVAGNSR